MNILIITDYFEVGGNVTYITNLRKTLEKFGHTIKQITFRSSQNLTQRRQSENNHYDIDIKDYQLRFFPSRIFLLYRLLAKLLPTWKPDLIISDLCQAAGAMIICNMLLRSLHSVPFFYQFHGSDAHEKKSGIEHFDQNRQPVHLIKKKIHIFLLYVFEKIVLDRVSGIVILSEYSRKFLKDLRVTSKIYKIVPGCEEIFKKTYLTYTKKGARRLCGLSSKGKFALIISRLEPRKGVFHILETLHSHQSFLAKTNIILCSQFDSYFGSDIIRLHSQYLFGNSVMLFNNPSSKDKALLYRAADVVLIPSLSLETFGFVALESYATGTPVVAYKLEAFKELIDHHWLVTPVGDGEKLLRKTQQLLSTSKAKQKAMSKAVVKYSEQFSWETYTQQIVRVAQSLQSSI